MIIPGGRSPNDSFLDLYLEYTRNQEAPDSFHLWTAITALAAALGRKCYLTKGYYHLYPNFFVVLVAGSAVCRKSTAIRLGIITPDEVSLFENIGHTQIYQGSITPEQFTKELSDAKLPSKDDPTRLVCPNVLIHSSELSVFLKKQSYAEPLINILTDLFDCPRDRSYKTKNRGIDTVSDAFICILAGTTPESIAGTIPPSALKEGFASRVIWVYEPTTDRVFALPKLTPRQVELGQMIKKMLEERSKIGGEFTLSKESEEYYTEWYGEYIRTPAPDRYLEGLYTRKHDNVLRLAIIYAANYLENIIEPHHIDAAIQTLNNVEAKAPGAFMMLGGKPDFLPHFQRARTFLIKHKRIQHSEFQRLLLPCDAVTLKQQIIPTLTGSGEVEVDSSSGAIVYVWKGGKV